MQIQYDFFYRDNGLISLTHPKCLQGEFDTLTGIFDRVGLLTNVRKEVSMICRPCHVSGNQLEEAYEHRMTGAGLE